VDHEASAPDDSASPSRAVLAGRIEDLSKVPEMVLRLGIARVDTGVHLTKKDPDKFRLRGKTGPGHIDHPLTRRAQKDGREAEIVVAKIRRTVRLREAAIRKKETSKAQKIIQLSQESSAKEVAKLVGVTADHVRRVVKRNKPA
jgi:hypothetical protein